MSSSSSAAPVGLEGGFPITRELLGARSLPPSPVAYGGPLPALPRTFREALRETWDLRIDHDPAAFDPLTSRAFGILYAHVRAEQVLLALSSRTNLTLAGATVRVVGDGALAPVLTTALRRLGAAVVRATDDPVERLAARLDGVRVEPVSTAGTTAFTLLTGVGHDGVSALDFAGIVADAAPRPTTAASLPSPRAHVGTTPRGTLVEMPSPLPADTEPTTAAQRRLADALVAALVVDDGPDGDSGAFAAAVTP